MGAAAIAGSAPVHRASEVNMILSFAMIVYPGMMGGESRIQWGPLLKKLFNRISMRPMATILSGMQAVKNKKEVDGGRPLPSFRGPLNERPGDISPIANEPRQLLIQR